MSDVLSKLGGGGSNSLEMEGWHKCALEHIVEKVEGHGFKHIGNGYFALGEDLSSSDFPDDYYHVCWWEKLNMQHVKLIDAEELVMPLEEQPDHSGKCKRCDHVVDANTFCSMKLVGYRGK